MELLVRVVDKRSDDKVNDIMLTKRGDVIVVKPDGHDWTERERTYPEWRILRLPDMTEAEAYSFISPQKPTDAKLRFVLAPRAKRIDLDAIGVAVDEKDRDDSRYSLSKQQVMNAGVMKEPPKTEVEIKQMVIGPK
jgi:hypothetical protein